MLNRNRIDLKTKPNRVGLSRLVGYCYFRFSKNEAALVEIDQFVVIDDVIKMHAPSVLNSLNVLLLFYDHVYVFQLCFHSHHQSQMDG